MKINQFLATVVAALAISVCSYAQDGPRRGGPRGGGFQPTLEGTWQLCSLAQGQDGQPQLSLLPMLKVFSSDGKFQNIGIPSEGGCFIEKQGAIEKTSDSTYVEKIRKFRPDSTANEPATIHFRFRGPMWLIMDYKEPGKEEATNELWMRVRQQGRDGQAARGEDPRSPRMNGQRGQGRPQGGGRGGQRGMNRQYQQNPFEDLGGGGNNGNDFDDFE